MTKAVKTQKTTTTVEQTTQVVELDKSLEAAIARFNDAKDAIKVLEQQKKEAEELLREAMGNAEVGLIGGVKRVEIKPRSRETLNTAVLKEVFPEAYEQCRGETFYTILTAVS